MADAVECDNQGEFFVIALNNPPVNALAHAVRNGLLDALGRALEAPDVEAIVLIGRGSTFSAGADVKELGARPQEPLLSEIVQAFDRSKKPIVAAMHGSTLGGGLELALACNYRVALADARFGLPEVKLGLLPGAGGSQRLPRLIGAERALELIATGATVDATTAKAVGLVDAVFHGDLLQGAIDFARRHQERRPLPRASERSDRLEPSRSQPELFQAARARIAKRARGAVAPLRCVDAVEAALTLPFEQGLGVERALFTAALSAPESAALRHAFFAERRASKLPDIAPSTATLSVTRVAIIGAGTMGAGIAIAFANAGIEVALVDREPSLLEQSLAGIGRHYRASVDKGRLEQAEMDARFARIRPETDWERLRDTDLVVEAVFEDMALKREVFFRLDAICKPHAILATNTSTLDVDAIAAATRRPEQVIGLHFFSPAHTMRLVEIVRGERTSKDVIQTSLKLAKRLGKVGVVVRVCEGFVGNRMLHQYYREANFLVQEGALPEQVDRVMTEFGMALGPFATSDLAGIDVGYRIRKAKGRPPSGERYFGEVPDRLAELGRYGQKTGAGFYRYAAAQHTPLPDPAVERLILDVSRELGIERRAVEDVEVLERCLYAMINEGAKILEEKIALRASDIDTVWLNGYGFPAHRGGPLHHADTLGLARIYESIGELRRRHGEVWKPATLLERLAREGLSFASLDAS